MTTMDGQIVAITGAARGIGYATAREFVHRGALVAISDVDEEALEVAARELGAAYYAPLDVSDGEAFDRFLEDVEGGLGSLDALVNNAGIMPSGPLLDESDRLARTAFEVNVLGLIHGTKCALRLMIPRGSGHIVNVCSTMGEVPVPGLSTYNASKAAAIMFTDAVRLEFRESGVHVSAVLPGGVNTDLVSGLDASISIPLPAGHTLPLVKHVNAQEVALAVVRTVEGNRSRARVYVPRAFGLLLNSTRGLPRTAVEALNRALGGERKALHETDTNKRAAYAARIEP